MGSFLRRDRGILDSGVWGCAWLDVRKAAPNKVEVVQGRRKRYGRNLFCRFVLCLTNELP